MVRRLLIVISLLIILFSTGCTHFEYLTNLGKEALFKGDLTRAESIFQDLREYAPHAYQSYLYQGFIYLYRDRPQEAIEAFHSSLKYNKEPELEYLGLGHAYMALRDYEKARDYLEQAIAGENYPVAEYLLGFIYLQADHKSAAKDALNAASKIYPERGEIWAALGKLSMENLQILDAAQAYQMAYVHGIRTYDLYTGLAESYYQLGNYRQAIAVVEQALLERHISPEEKEQLRLKLAQYNIEQNPSKAIESLEAILANNPGKPEVQLMLGQLYYQQENYQAALNIFGQYLQQSPPLAQVLYLIYKSQLALENTKLAEKYLLDAIALKPQTLSYYLDLINLYHNEKRLKDLIPVYKKAMELRSQDPQLVSNLISIYLELGEYENAITYLRRAIELDPQNYDLYLIKANAHYKLNQIEAEQTTYETILKLAPNHILALNNLAQLMRDTNRLEEAFELYKKALAIDPKDGRYDRNLGYIFLVENNYLEARDWLNKAIMKNPEDYESYRFLGDTYFATDNYSEAIQAYEKSLQIKPDYPYVLYPLGKAYFYTDELDKAKKNFEAYLKLFPQNDGSQFYLTRIEWLKDQNTLDIEMVPAEPTDEQP